MRSLIRFMSQVFSGLRFRLLVLVVFTCAPLVIVILHVAGQDRRLALTNWAEKQRELQQLAGRQEAEAISGAHQLLLALSESAPVHSLESRRCKKAVDELFSAYPSYANLGILTTNGELLASALPTAVANQSNRRADEGPSFASLTSSAYPKNHLLASVLEKRDFVQARNQVADSPRGVSFGMPVLTPTGEIKAVAFADLDLRYFSRSQTELANELPREAVWTEIDRQGNILARYPDAGDWVGHLLPEHELLPKFLSNTDGVIEATTEAGVPSFFSFSSRSNGLDGGEVLTLLSIPKRVLFLQADRDLRRNLTWLGIAAGLATLLGWLGGKLLILRPVKALVRSSTRVAAGDFSARARLPHTRDELAQLTLAFDQMAQALEHRELERQRASHKLQLLSHRLVEVQESERRHIARELHDEIGQSLTAAEMNLQAALQAPGAAALEKRLEDSIQAVERVLEQVHDLSLNLRPSMLDDLGLEPALRWYTHRQAALTGMTAEFRSDELDERLDPVIETECFRVAQEALTNVVRHSQAHAVWVALSRRNGHIHLSVRDDGVGFNVTALRGEAVRGASLGLLSMEERTALAGGGLEFKSAPGEGTEIHAWFPLKWQNPSHRVELND